MELIDLKKALADRAEEVCRHLLPGGKLKGPEWVCGDLAGADGSSLNVRINGDKAGVWRDFAGNVGGSNLLELWIQAKGLPFQEALAAAKEWLGTRGVVPTNVRPMQKRTYSKPNKAGVVWLANKAEFYLLSERRIPKEVIELYKIGMTADGLSIVFPYLHETNGEVQMIKFMDLARDEKGKKVIRASANTAKVLFGKHTVRPEDRYLIITEGEVDALTYRAAGLTAVSLPFGAKWEGQNGNDPNSEWIENDWEFLNRFERIYLSMDMDEEGRKAQASIIKRLGQEICFVIELPVKDANELWLLGRGAELKVAFDKAKTIDPVNLKNASAYREKVLDDLYGGDAALRRGIPLPFGNYPFHLRWNEWTVVTGQNGAGKTQVLGHILVHLWGLTYPSCVASLEVRPEKTLRYYVSQTVGKKLPDRAEAEAALDWLAGGFWMFDHVGEVKYREVLAAFRYAYRRHGVRFFVIDSWMKMGISGDDLEAQAECCNAISDFVRDCDVHVFVVAHPRKLKNESEVVNKMDVKGSGELTDQAHNVMLIWRNKQKEKLVEKMTKAAEEPGRIVQVQRSKPDTVLFIGKQRNDDGDEPTIDLWFHKESKQFFGHYRSTGESHLEPKKPAPVEVAVPAGQPEEDDQPF